MSKTNYANYPVFTLSYKLLTIKKYVLAAYASTSLITAGCVFIHPYLGLITLYDWYLLAKTSILVGRTCEHLILSKQKRLVKLTHLNWFGFKAKPAMYNMNSVADILYTGPVKNYVYPFYALGVPPSILKLYLMATGQNKSDPK